MVEYKRKIIRKTIDKDFNIKEGIEIKNGNKSRHTGSYQYINIGFYLITPLLAGVFCGLFLDNRFGTRPVFIIIGLLLGVVGTFYNLYRLTKLD